MTFRPQVTGDWLDFVPQVAVPLDWLTPKMDTEILRLLQGRGGSLSGSHCAGCGVVAVGVFVAARLILHVEPTTPRCETPQLVEIELQDVMNTVHADAASVDAAMVYVVMVLEFVVYTLPTEIDAIAGGGGGGGPKAVPYSCRSALLLRYFPTGCDLEVVEEGWH